MSDGISHMEESFERLEKDLLALREFLVKISVQYQNYDENQWTVFERITPENAKRYSHDYSIKRIRIEIRI